MQRKCKGIVQKEGGGRDFILLAGVRRDVFNVRSSSAGETEDTACLMFFFPISF